MSPPADWSQLSHRQLYDAVQSGPGRAISVAAEEHWTRIEAAITGIERRITAALAGSNGGWEGPAADTTRTSVSPLGAWALDAAGDARLTSGAVVSQAEHAAELRRLLPPPVAAEPTPGPIAGRIGRLPPSPEAVAQQAAADADARRLMADYVNHSYENDRYLDYWTVPPTVTVDSAPVGPAGAGAVAARSPVGTHGAGAGPSGPDGGGPGGAGSGLGVGPVGVNPGSPGAGAGAAGAAGAGVGVPEGGTPGLGVAGVAGPGAAGPGAPVPGGPVPGGPVPAGAVPAGAVPGGALPVPGRSTGGAAGPSAPGSGGAGGRATGPTGVGAGRPAAGRLPAGGSGGAGPGGVGSGSGSEGPAGRGPTSVLTRGQPGDPGEATAGGRGPSRSTSPLGGGTVRPVVPEIPRGGPGPSWRDLVPDAEQQARAARPGAAETAPRAALVAEEAVRPAGARAAGATGLGGIYPPMMGGGAGSRGGEHRRPGWLVDGTGAFDDDRWFPPAVLTPEDL